MTLILEVRLENLEKQIIELQHRIVDIESRLDQPSLIEKEPEFPTRRQSNRGYSRSLSETPIGDIPEVKVILDHLKRFDLITYKEFKDHLQKNTSMSPSKIRNLLKKLSKEGEIRVEMKAVESGEELPFISMKG